MVQRIPIDDPPLTPEEEARIARLSDSELIEIAEALLSNAKSQRRKVAIVVALSMSSLSHRLPGIPDVFYGMRIQKLVQDGVLESQGSLGRMRFSEVRLGTPSGSHGATRTPISQ